MSPSSPAHAILLNHLGFSLLVLFFTTLRMLLSLYKKFPLSIQDPVFQTQIHIKELMLGLSKETVISRVHYR